MAADFAGLIRIIYKANGSLDEKLTAGQELTEALLSPGDAHEGSQLPDLLRAHYAASLLDWLLSAIARSGGGSHVNTSGKKASKKKEENAAALVEAHQDASGQLELWCMLVTILQSPITSPNRPLPASLLTSITSAMQLNLSSSYQEKLLHTLAGVLQLLGGKFASSFKPALEPTAVLVEGALVHRNTPCGVGAAAAAVQLMLPLLQLHPNPRKAWDAVVPRLTAVLADSAFKKESDTAAAAAADDDGTTTSGRSALREASLAVLSASAFAQSHVPGLSDAAVITAESAGTKTNRSYASLLFDQVERLVNAEGAISTEVVFQALPWFVEQYCAAFKEFRRAATIAAAIASASSAHRPSHSQDAEQAENEGRSIGGVPIDADFRVFAAITAILQRKLDELTSKGAGGGRTVAEHNCLAIFYLLRTLAAVCSTLKRCHIYRPTEDPEGHHRNWLGALVNTAVALGKTTSSSAVTNAATDGSLITGAALEVLQAILAVEHKGVQQHLPSLWPMLWSQTTAHAAGTAAADKSSTSSTAVQINVAVSLVEAYAELRQLEVLFSSLVHALCAMDEAVSPAAAELLGSRPFLGALHSGIASVPSGQVAALVRMVTRWIPELKEASAPLVVGDLGAACLAALTVDITTAPAVADAAEGLVAALAPFFLPILDKKAREEFSEDKARKEDRTATCLALYCHVLRLHSLCSQLHPEVHPLPGQDLHHSKKESENSTSSTTTSQGGYFDALAHSTTSTDLKNLPIPHWPSEDYSTIWELGGQASGASPALQAAVLAAAGQRIQTIYYRNLHAEHACKELKEAKLANVGAAGVNEELEMLGSLLTDCALSGNDIIQEESFGFEPDLLMEGGFFLSTLGPAAVPAVARGVILQGVTLDALQGAFPPKRLGSLVRLLIDEADLGSLVVERLASPEFGAVVPAVVTKKVHQTLSDIVAHLSDASDEKEASKKKARGDSGESTTLNSATEELLKCLKRAAKGKLGGKDAQSAQSALVQISDWLEERSSTIATRGTTIPGSKPGKRKSRSENVIPFAVTNGLYVLTSLWSRVGQMDLSSVPVEGRETLFLAGLAAAAVALGAASFTSPSEAFSAINAASTALGVVASLGIDNASASNLKSTRGSDDSSKLSLVMLAPALPNFLGSLANYFTSIAVAVGPVPGRDGLLHHLRDIMQALTLRLFYSKDSSSGDEGNKADVQALETWENKALKSGFSLGNAILLEGMLRACRQALVNNNSYSSNNTAGNANEGGKGEYQNITVGVFHRSPLQPGTIGITLAPALVINFEQHCTPLSQLASTEDPTLMQKFAAVAACVSHVIAIRCLGDVEALQALTSTPSPLISHLSEDLPAVASVLSTVLQTGSLISDSGDLEGSVINLLGYIEAVSLATSAMKPAASPAHYTSMLCLILHVLRLLRVESSAVDPKRRTIPLTAAFPAARAGPGSEARSAALRALQILLNGSNSHEIRAVLTFCEGALSSTDGIGSVTQVYRLPITELALMALEGCRGKEALRTLGQHSDRLAAALTTSIANSACTISQNSTSTIDGGSSASFAALHAAFMAVLVPAQDGEVSASPVAAAPDTSGASLPNLWTLQNIPSSSSEESALAVATAVRALESIAARPKPLPLSSRHIARILHSIDALCTPKRSIETRFSFSFPKASTFVNFCHLLTALTRHREGDLGRCLPLLGHAVRALLAVLVRWEAETPTGKDAGVHCSQAFAVYMAKSAVKVQCGEALAAVMAEIAGLKAAEKYCPHILADYLILAACPATPTALGLIGLPQRANLGEEAGPRGGLLCSTAVGAALRQGAYAVYGACGTGGVQYVYASVGSRGSGGLWRAGLAALKADHDKNFKYTGKV